MADDVTFGMDDIGPDRATPMGGSDAPVTFGMNDLGVDGVSTPIASPKETGSFMSMFTGEGRREELPELSPQFVPGKGETKTRMGLSADPKGQLEIYLASNPGAKWRQDQWGNYIVQTPEGERYLNKPGMSAQDVDDIGGAVLTTLPFAGVGGRLLKGAGLLGRVFGTGVGSGVGSIAQDKAAQAAGSKQPVSMERAALSGALGGGAELFAPAASSIYRAVVRNPVMYDAASGTLTTEGAATLSKLGVKPDQITDTLARTFAEEAKKAVSPKQALAAAQAKSLPVPMKLTKGQITGRPSDQLFEDMASKGAYGEMAETTMRGMQAKQQGGLRANAEAIQAQLAGGPERIIAHPNDAGEIVAEKLTSLAGQKKAGVTAAYDAARETPAGVPASLLGEVTFNMRNAVAKYSPSKVKAVEEQIGRIEAMSQSGNASTLLRNIESVRQGLGPLRKSGDASEAAAASAAITELDNSLSGLFERSLVEGDDAALALWKAARERNTEYMRTFKAGDAIERIVKGDVSPERSIDAIFNAQRVFGGKDTAATLNSLKSTLDADSWNALRQAAWLRMVNQGTNAAGEISGAKLRTELSNAMLRNRDILGALFTKDELALISQFKDVAVRATGADATRNFSNTAPAMANIAQKLFAASFMGENAAARLMAVPAINMVFRTSMALKTAGTMGAKPAARTIPPGLLGGSAAVAGQQYNQSKR